MRRLFPILGLDKDGNPKEQAGARDQEQPGAQPPRDLFNPEPQPRNDPNKPLSALERRRQKAREQLNELQAQRAEAQAQIDNILLGVQSNEEGLFPEEGADPSVPNRRTTPNRRTPVNPRGDFPPEYEGGLGEGARGLSAAERLRQQRLAQQRQAQGNRRQPTTRQPTRPRPGGASLLDQAEEVDQPKLLVTAHDLTAEAGKTYRYRITVNMLNPLFKRRDLSDEQVRANATKLVISSEPSAWSSEVKFEQFPQTYTVKVDRNQAEYEVWHIFNGKLRSDTFNVRAGDVVGEPVRIPYTDGEATVDLTTDLVVVDLVETEGDRGRARQVVLETDMASGNLREVDPELERNAPNRQRNLLKAKRAQLFGEQLGRR